MIRTLLCLLFLVVYPPPLFGQIPLSVANAEEQGKASAVLPLEKPDEDRSRVTAHMEEAGHFLEEAEAALDVSSNPSSEDSQHLQQRVELLQERIQIGRRHLTVIEDVEAVRAEKGQLQSEANGWTGFADPPPFSLAFVEELARKLKFHQAAKQSDELRLASFVHGKELADGEFAAAEKAYRKTLETLEAARNDAVRQSARRQHDLSQLALRVGGEGVAFVRDSEQLYKEKLALSSLHEGFLRRKLSLALRDLVLTQGEVQARLDSLRQELNAANQNLEHNTRAESALRQVLATEKPGPAVHEEPSHSDVLADLARELRQQELDILLAAREDINLHIGYIQSQQALWRKRLELHQKWDFARAKAQDKEISTILGVVDEGIRSFVLAQSEDENFVVGSRYTRMDLVPARESLQKALMERAKLRGATLQRARQFKDFLEAWHGEIEARIGDMGVAEGANGWKEVVGDYLKRYWNFELLSVEDTLVVDGVRIVEKRPVTVGKIVEAVLILMVGLLVSSWLSRLVSRMILPFSMEKWQSRLLVEKVLRLCMTALVVVLALITVKIPLAVFAFLGGAIAIGIGFGAKNLINNFISGFILLGEGVIRAGDRIEIEGTRGVVQSIGERSTHVRRVDGVDILIPNSQFLENSVTNMTLSDQRVRVTIQVGVAYGSPTRQVHELLLEIANAHELVVRNPAPFVVFRDFGESALVFQLNVWIDLTAQSYFRMVETELRHIIAEQFVERGFEMPFPQRGLHFDSPVQVQVLD